MEKYKSGTIVWEDKMCMWKQDAGRADGTRNVPFLKRCNYSSEMGLTKSSCKILMASQTGESFLWDLIYVLKESTACSVCVHMIWLSPLLSKLKRSAVF